MKRLILLAVLWLTVGCAFAQSNATGMPDSVRQYLEKSLKIIQENALNINQANWPAVRAEVYAKAASARTY